jgi:hypothetical protein
VRDSINYLASDRIFYLETYLILAAPSFDISESSADIYEIGASKFYLYRLMP